MFYKRAPHRKEKEFLTFDEITSKQKDALLKHCLNNGVTVEDLYRTRSVGRGVKSPAITEWTYRAKLVLTDGTHYRMFWHRRTGCWHIA